MSPGQVGVLWTRGADDNDRVFNFTHDLPSMLAGDAQFLEDDPTRPVQLRPALQSECPRRKLLRSDRVIAYPGRKAGPPIWAFVRLPPFERENTPVNVRRAIRSLVSFDAGLAALLSRAERGEDV